MAPRTRNIARRLRRRHDETNAARRCSSSRLVVVLLITLLYGIITYGLILAAQSTITQAAADAARAGIVQGTGTHDLQRHRTTFPLPAAPRCSRPQPTSAG